MRKQATDLAPGIGAVTTRRSFPSVVFSKACGTQAMLASGPRVPGEETRRAIFAQPDWLRGVPERVGGRRLPDGRVVFTGCGTSFHAAMTGGGAVHALELVLRPERDADLLVLISHEGETPLTLEAAR